MYTLRIIEKGRQTNQSLGDHYSLVDRFTNYDEFTDLFERFFGYGHVADLDTTSDRYTKECRGFVVYESGSKLIPLYNFQYYIMTDSGKTFTRL